MVLETQYLINYGSNFFIFSLPEKNRVGFHPLVAFAYVGDEPCTRLLAPEVCFCICVSFCFGGGVDPLTVHGRQVSTGYGRGSKKLGVPTANLPESQFAENLRTLPTGG